MGTHDDYTRKHPDLFAARRMGTERGGGVWGGGEREKQGRRMGDTKRGDGQKKTPTRNGESREINEQRQRREMGTGRQRSKTKKAGLKHKPKTAMNEKRHQKMVLFRTDREDGQRKNRDERRTEKKTDIKR